MSADLDKLVERFLAWPVPPTARADLCATMAGYPHQRYGTHFFTADEARQMLAHVLGGWEGTGTVIARILEYRDAASALGCDPATEADLVEALTEAATTIQSLRAERDQFAAIAAEREGHWMAIAKRAEAERDQAVEALKPFHAAAERNASYPPADGVSLPVPWRFIRLASQVYSNIKGEEGG